MWLCIFMGLGRAEAESAWVGIELERGTHGGVGVRGVVPGAPASLTDLSAGDEVQSIDGVAVHTAEALAQAIRARPIGRRLTLSVRDRSGAIRAVVLAPAARPSDVALARQRLLDRPAPSFVLPRVGARAGEATEDGLVAHKGRLLLIDFWATWCGPCVRALPELSALAARYRGRGLDLVGISTEPADRLLPAMAQHAVAHSILSDGNEGTFRAYGIGAMPTLVLVDRRGVVRAVHIGGDLAAVEASVRELLLSEALR